MPEGYASTPLFKKLGLKKDFLVTVIHPPENYKDLIGEINDELIFRNKNAAGLDFIHFFTNSRSELERTLPGLKAQIKKDGIIWVSWYKKSTGKSSELSDNIVRDTALALGLVDTKVCAVNEEWSGLKLVIRVRNRQDI